MKPGENHHEDVHPVSVAAGYEDFESGLRAVNLYQRVLREHTGGNEHYFKLWKFEPLSLPGVFDEAVQTAAEAELVVVSVRGDRALSREALRWIHAWSELKQGREGAISLLVAPEYQNRREARSIHEFLENVAVETGLELFSSISRRVQDDAVLPAAGTYVTTPVVDAVRRSNSFVEHWGINE